MKSEKAEKSEDDTPLTQLAIKKPRKGKGKGPGGSDQAGSTSRDLFTFGSVAATGKAGASKSNNNREVNKSDGVATEAAQLIQMFDDPESIFQLTEAKMNAMINKINPRLSVDVVSTCVTDDSEGKGLKVVALLREQKSQLSAALPVVSSLAASQGEQFHHASLQSAMLQARQAGLRLTTAVDSVLAVRELSYLAECMDWSKLVDKVSTGLESLDSSESASKLRVGGCVHAVEAVMRLALPPSEIEIPIVAAERLNKLKDFVKLLKESSAWKLDDMKTVSEELGYLLKLIDFTVEKAATSSEVISAVEQSRTLIASKSALLLKCVTAFPLGVWLMDAVQEGLSQYHVNKALSQGLESVTPD